MGGAVPPLPNTPSWRGAQLRGAQGQLYLLPSIHLQTDFCMSMDVYVSNLIIFEVTGQFSFISE
jgi:hypothetical protein